jgi:hypothetical protein
MAYGRGFVRNANCELTSRSSSSFEKSTRPAAWNRISLAAADERYQFFDPEATNAPLRYYRLRWT